MPGLHECALGHADESTGHVGAPGNLHSVAEGFPEVFISLRVVPRVVCQSPEIGQHWRHSGGVILFPEHPQGIQMIPPGLHEMPLTGRYITETTEGRGRGSRVPASVEVGGERFENCQCGGIVFLGLGNAGEVVQ